MRGVWLGPREVLRDGVGEHMALREHMKLDDHKTLMTVVPWRKRHLEGG